MDDDGPRSTAWSAYEATQRTARAARAAARAWLEDGAKDQVRYFAEGGASRQALEDADCVEGCIARLARGDAAAAARARRPAEARRAAGGAGPLRRDVAPRPGGAARGRRGPERGRADGGLARGRAAGRRALGLRGLRAGRQPAAAALAGCCPGRAAAALEATRALRLHGEAVAAGVRRVATDDRAADARGAARELGDAAAHEAAVFGAWPATRPSSTGPRRRRRLGGPGLGRAGVQRGARRRRRRRDGARGPRRRADGSVAGPEARGRPARRPAPGGLRDAGGGSAALAAAGARAIPEALESLDGDIAAPLALVWRRIYGDDPNADRACDAVLRGEAQRLCDAGYCGLAPTYAGLILEDSLRVDAGAAVAALARGEDEVTATRAALDASLGPRDAAKACRLAVARVFDDADAFLEKRPLPAADAVRGVSDGDALRVAALRLLKPKPLELVRAANALLAGHGGQAFDGGAWACADAILEAVSDQALDDAHSLARHGDDGAAAAVEAHLGWRCARTAVAASEELTEDAHARVVAALQFPRVAGGDVEIRWRGEAVLETRRALAEKGAAVDEGWLRGADAPLAGAAAAYLAEVALDHARRAGDASGDFGWYARGLRVADCVAAPDAARGRLSVEDARRLMGKLKAVAVECLRAGGGAGAEVRARGAAGRAVGDGTRGASVD